MFSHSERRSGLTDTDDSELLQVIGHHTVPATPTSSVHTDHIASAVSSSDLFNVGPEFDPLFDRLSASAWLCVPFCAARSERRFSKYSGRGTFVHTWDLG